ncbi:alanine racemase domain protein [Treponema primitia ZAS-2]|uniref:Alanine racemase domain protein n=1 Tax=Treponema primitia (strain ATCC BAA-887 / DSM 12427 / ZAS-2) TaxID=545694 RepID=F5YGZ5_TREPZ|nr:alanine racemase [Treponema primitia]AEF85877.1 alanine racemase domain protein [Treponema primitia ZAS-2]
METLTQAQLETPCLVINMEQVRENITAMQKIADTAGCRLRPHVKTHKMPLFARMQVEAGASGICCAKVSEAEVMADGGLQDIFIAYPLVGDFRIQRALILARRITRLILAVDSLQGALALSQAAVKAGQELEVRLEIDTGAKRTGIPLEEASLLAEAVYKMPGLRLTGIYTFKGLNYQGTPTEENELAAQEESSLMERAAKKIEALGIKLPDISGGSSPTGAAVARLGKINEIRPGTYIFKDLMLCSEKVAQPSEIAVRYVATVVSCPREDYAVIDGGTKCFPTDVVLHTAPFQYTAYARVEGREDLLLDRMNEEHGIIRSVNGKTLLSVGQRITLIPLHVCTAINMHNQVYLEEAGKFRLQRVEARGMVV